MKMRTFWRATAPVDAMPAVRTVRERRGFALPMAILIIAFGRAKPRRSREVRAAGIASTGAVVRQNGRIFMGLSGS